MKYCFLIILTILLIGNEGRIYANDEPYIERIEVMPLQVFSKSHPPAIGDTTEIFSTKVYMSDGTMETEEKNKNMNWIIERYDNESKMFITVKKGEGVTMDFWMPYGTLEGQYKVTVTSKLDPNATGYTWYQLNYPWYTETFCIFQPGTVKYGVITTKDGNKVKSKEMKRIKAEDIREEYNWNTKKYTCILPNSPYKTKDYTFEGWKIDGKLYKEGSKFVAGYEDVVDYHNAYFEAKWKPKFKAPDVVANRVGKKKIKLRWNRMIGGKGYKIYRLSKKNGKYKLIKTIKDKWKTTWTDKKVEKGQVYYYKVAAYKKLKGKLVQKKSLWVMTSTKAAKVKRVKINKSIIYGEKGNSSILKAVVKTGKGKKLSRKVRWYTSNKKISTVNKKTGKVTFVEKGNCYIWAKAHNGKNSKKVVVRVK